MVFSQGDLTQKTRRLTENADESLSIDGSPVTIEDPPFDSVAELPNLASWPLNGLERHHSSPAQWDRQASHSRRGRQANRNHHVMESQLPSDPTSSISDGIPPWVAQACSTSDSI